MQHRPALAVLLETALLLEHDQRAAPHAPSQQKRRCARASATVRSSGRAARQSPVVALHAEKAAAADLFERPPQLGLKDDRNRDRGADDASAAGSSPSDSRWKRFAMPSKPDEHEDSDQNLHGARAANQQQHVVDQDAGRDDVDDVGDTDVAARCVLNTIASDPQLETRVPDRSPAPADPSAAIAATSSGGSGESTSAVRAAGEASQFSVDELATTTRTPTRSDPIRRRRRLGTADRPTSRPGARGRPGLRAAAARLRRRRENCQGNDRPSRIASPPARPRRSTRRSSRLGQFEQTRTNARPQRCSRQRMTAALAQHGLLERGASRVVGARRRCSRSGKSRSFHR